MGRVFGGRFREIVRRKGLIYSLAEREVKVRYKRSGFGILWAFAEPALLVGLYYLVFGRIIRLEVPEYPLFLISGILVFQFWSGGIAHAVPAIVVNANLVKKVYFPREILPFSVVVGRLVHLLIALGLWILFLWVVKGRLSGVLWLLPVALLAATVTLASLAMLVAACHVYFSDTGFLVNFLLMAVFYLTPVVYPVSYIPEGWRSLYLANPPATTVELVRAILLDYPEARSPALWGALALQGAAFLPACYLLFVALERRLGEVL